MELLMSRLWPGDPPGRLPRIMPYAAGFHTTLFNLRRDEPMTQRSSWAQLYKRIAPVLAKATNAESAEGHTGVCIPVHTTGHWVLVVLHLQTASFTVYNSVACPRHPQVEAAIDTVKFRLDQLASSQASCISWGSTNWVAPTHLAQQYDLRAPELAGGDCLLFVCSWTLCILSGDTPSPTTVRQKHMRNIRNQLLLIALEGDAAHSRRRTDTGDAPVIDLCAEDDNTVAPDSPVLRTVPDRPPLEPAPDGSAPGLVLRNPAPHNHNECTETQHDPLHPGAGMEQDSEGMPLTNKRMRATSIDTRDGTQDGHARRTQHARLAHQDQDAYLTRHTTQEALQTPQVRRAQGTDCTRQAPQTQHAGDAQHPISIEALDAQPLHPTHHTPSMEIGAATPALSRKRNIASIAPSPKTQERRRRPQGSQQHGEPHTSAPRGQQGTHNNAGCGRVRQPQDTAFNESNSKADEKQGHDPYG